MSASPSRQTRNAVFGSAVTRVTNAAEPRGKLLHWSARAELEDRES